MLYEAQLSFEQWMFPRQYVDGGGGAFVELKRKITWSIYLEVHK